MNATIEMVKIPEAHSRSTTPPPDPNPWNADRVGCHVASTAPGAKLKNLEWTDLGVRGSRLMGDESTIAQVHPKEHLGLKRTEMIRFESAQMVFNWTKVVRCDVELQRTAWFQLCERNRGESVLRRW